MMNKMNLKVKVEVVNKPAGFARFNPNPKDNVFSSMPPEVAVALFEEMLAMQELLDKGERCAKCGEMHLPEDLTQDLCGECLFDMALVMAEEMEAELRAEEEALEEMAELMAMVDEFEKLFDL